MSIVIVGYDDALCTENKSFMLYFAVFLVQAHKRPTMVCQFLSIGRLTRSTGRENQTLTSSARFVLELTGIRKRFTLFKQPGLPRKDPQMAACIKFISNFFYLRSLE